MTPEEILEVDEEPITGTKLPPGTKLSKKEAVEYIAWKMFRAGLADEPVTEKEAKQDAKEDEILKEFGM